MFVSSSSPTHQIVAAARAGRRLVHSLAPDPCDKPTMDRRNSSIIDWKELSTGSDTMFSRYELVAAAEVDTPTGMQHALRMYSTITLGEPDLASEQKPAITIADATYLYTQKSSNNLLQTMADLILFACGTYQINQARSYVGEHIRFHGIYTLEVSRDQIPGLQGINPMLLRAKIKSLHSSGKT
ncbi:unnamed protein product [Leptidea sinapis]|uniref:Uncharacterized protein n=1 Tax=Leptidea sinapis TaxID=189913 RepID=A0A5E4QQF0_9NEOP|nr:unnamed protein product [Leptidea sinapis]